MPLHVAGTARPVGEDGLGSGHGRRGRACRPCFVGLTGSLRSY